MTQDLLLYIAVPLLRHTTPDNSSTTKSPSQGRGRKISCRRRSRRGQEWAGVGRELRSLADSLGQSGARRGEELNTAPSLLYSLITVAILRNITNRIMTFI